MIGNNNETFQSYKNKKSVFCLALVFLLIATPELLSYYTAEGIAPQALLHLSMLSILLLFYYSSVKRLNALQRYFLFCCFLMLLLSVFNMDEEIPKLTLLFIYLLMFFGIICKPIELNKLNYALVVCAIVWTPIIIYQVGNADLNIGAILQRGYTWTEVFFYYSVTSIWVPLLFSSVLLRKNVALSMIFWMIALFMGLISLKRDIVVESVIAFLIILFIAFKLNDVKMRRYSVGVIVLVLGLGTYFVLNGSISNDSLEIFDAMSNRFSNTADDIGSFDRLVESKKYFSQEADFFNIIFGKGFISAHHSFSEAHLYLHIGWLNFIFKGGLLFLLGILYGYRRVFIIFLSPQYYPLNQVFASMYCMLYFFDLFFSNMMGFGPTLFLFFYCLILVNRPKTQFYNRRAMSAV